MVFSVSEEGLEELFSVSSEIHQSEFKLRVFCYGVSSQRPGSSAF